MADDTRHVIVVTAEPETARKEIPFFNRSCIAVHYETSVAAVQELIGSVSCALVIVCPPLPELSLEDLLVALASEGSQCHQARVLVLARPEDSAPARARLGRGVDRLVNLEWAKSEMQPAVASLLGLCARHDLRATLALEVVLEQEEVEQTCLTGDLSRSGMRVQGCQPFPVGSRFKFELTLPEDKGITRSESNIVTGEAEVVRLIMRRDEAPGFGARFISISGSGQQLLDQLLAAQPGSPSPTAPIRSKRRV